MRAGLAALAVPLLAMGAGRGAPSKPAAAWKEAEAFYNQALARHGIVGSSLLVLSGDDVVGRATFGLADRDAGTHVDEDTIFHWASITKTFTGIAVMQLRDRGRLSLDDPIVKYLPELRLVHDPFGDMSAVTIRQLMSHSAGFRAPT